MLPFLISWFMVCMVWLKQTPPRCSLLKKNFNFWSAGRSDRIHRKYEYKNKLQVKNSTDSSGFLEVNFSQRRWHSDFFPRKRHDTFEVAGPIEFSRQGAQSSVWFISWRLGKIIGTAEWYWRCKHKQVDTSVYLRNKLDVKHAKDINCLYSKKENLNRPQFSRISARR